MLQTGLRFQPHGTVLGRGNSSQIIAALEERCVGGLTRRSLRVGPSSLSITSQKTSRFAESPAPPPRPRSPSIPLQGSYSLE